MSNKLELNNRVLFLNGKEVSRNTIKNNQTTMSEIRSLIDYCEALGEIEGIKFKFD
ncbi:hypothetical protein [Aquimarina sp. 2201CG5-10]|uniref:hypothetical protein n=1 Tax=Aquimarina callyspongiae TaxID=3098150 RepID=UPI002AB3C6E4|nr:hypothetical protein [Aquimarina sp. 2201CG5-10]MDY8137599.1 hypothetical protein [Aquimarina sp. 2201CG5-10]